MNSVIFNAARESYPVSSISYAGPVVAIPQEKRKGDSTHYFRIMTTMECVFCHFRSEETAKSARGALSAMMERCKPSTYRHGFEILDTRRIVSFSKVVALKEPAPGGHTHAVVVTMECPGARNNQVWLRYRSEENAQKGRQSLAAAIHAANMLLPPEKEELSGGDVVKEN